MDLAVLFKAKKKSRFFRLNDNRLGFVNFSEIVHRTEIIHSEEISPDQRQQL